MICKTASASKVFTASAISCAFPSPIKYFACGVARLVVMICLKSQHWQILLKVGILVDLQCFYFEKENMHDDRFIFCRLAIVACLR